MDRLGIQARSAKLKLSGQGKVLTQNSDGFWTLSKGRINTGWVGVQLSSSENKKLLLAAKVSSQKLVQLW